MMDLKNMVVTSIAATALFTGVASLGTAQADAAAQVKVSKTAKSKSGIMQKHYETYGKLFRIVKVNAEANEEGATVYYKDGGSQYINLSRIPRIHLSVSEIHGEVDRIDYDNDTGVTRTVRVNELSVYEIKTWGDLYYTVEKMYPIGTNVEMKDKSGKVIEVIVGEKYPVDPSQPIGTFVNTGYDENKY